MAEVARAPEHGGCGLDYLRRHHPGAPTPWLDLSTGISPWPYPHPPVSRHAWEALPSPSRLQDCRQAAAHCFGVSPGNLAMLPGSQAAISLLPRLFSPRTVQVLEPTYNEHARAWRLAGHDVRATSTLHDADADIVVLANPNNPDGRFYPRDTILAAAARRSAQSKWTIVDEAFIDLMPDASVGDACGHNQLMAFRSFGKFFGLAGVRLGFTIANEAIASHLEQMIGPWAISGMALETGAAAYRDARWQQDNRDRLHQQAARQRAVLAAAGLAITGGTDLFLLCEHANAAGLFDHLCGHGIHVRRFIDAPRHLRFGLTADDTQLNRLGNALQAWDGGP